LPEHHAIEQFFKKMPAAMPLYEAAAGKIFSLGEVSATIGKSQISFRSGRNFAWIWLPIRVIKGRPAVYIVLSFGLDHPIDHPRIVSAVKPYPNRWTHHVIIEKITDLDQEILDWLQQAYAFARNKQ